MNFENRHLNAAAEELNSGRRLFLFMQNSMGNTNEASMLQCPPPETPAQIPHKHTASTGKTARSIPEVKPEP
jgi:hypothetical protein